MEASEKSRTSENGTMETKQLDAEMAKWPEEKTAHSECPVIHSEGEKTKLVSPELYSESPPKDIVMDTEDTRLLESLPSRDVSNLRTYMNLFKTLTGPSTVGMPRVIRNGGLLTGFVGFLIIGFLNAHCNITMVKCSRVLGKRTGKTWYTYEDVVEESFASFFTESKWVKAAKYSRRLALWMLILCQLGLLSFYYQIIATTIKKEIELSFPTVRIPLVVMELCVCICVLPYSWLRNLKMLAWFSSFGNLLNIISIVTIIQYSVTHMLPVSSIHLVPPNPWTFPLFIGGAVFTVEGIAMILPIENRASRPQDYTGSFGIIAMATATNVLLNLTTGFYGYLAFGDEATGNILVSLPDMWWYRVISITYASVVFLTFNLQLYQPAEAIYAMLLQRFHTDFVVTFGNVGIRSAIVILTFLFAALIPAVELMMSLVGAFTAAFLVFILPIVCELILLRGEPGGISWFTWSKDIILLVFGVAAFVMGSYTSLRDIVLRLS
ncbi:proton-coupled amino acid transporter 4-like [Plakobranchus ocellatus]|uniref:Proton-coupled amino acid transporter 4-like n=1 Tax=Plakobranchus ocellatus TaxID=259542 RepID=A0AAV3YUL0_9GAST|nr:proton-coupled amino acid transporter 4-like [Plakobranchus ocellatus]